MKLQQTIKKQNNNNNITLACMWGSLQTPGPVPCLKREFKATRGVMSLSALSYCISSEHQSRLASSPRIPQCDLNRKSSGGNAGLRLTNPPPTTSCGFEAVWLWLWAMYCADPICWYNMPQCSHERLATLMNFVRHHHIRPDRIYNSWFYSCCVTLLMWFFFFLSRQPSNILEEKLPRVHKESLTPETMLLLRFCKNKDLCLWTVQRDRIRVVSNKTKRGRSNFIVCLKYCWWECIPYAYDH